MLRIAPGIVHRRAFDLVPHRDACFRPGLAWSVQQYPRFWMPTFAKARQFDGLGSYSSFLGDLTSPKWKQMAYHVNWDLSGRFFPYMGMFLPPMSSSSATWQNDPEGTQKHQNVSLDSIDSYYARVQLQGFSTLSYFNVFEFGRDVAPGPWRDIPPALDERHWQNATQYLMDNFRPALLTNYACSSRVNCDSQSWAPVHEKVQYSWQKSVVVDPRAGFGYDRSLLSQVKRKLGRLTHFQGLVVDRSDWNQVVSFEGPDDNHTLVGTKPGWSFKRSYLQILAAVRKMLDSAPGSPKVMLNNLCGYAWLPFMRHFDGSFSEGSDLNAVGILGLHTTSILWTYKAADVIADPDAYFQTHLRMAVFPMAPFPMNDHAINPGADVEAQYLQYGKMFESIRNTSWVLDARPIRVSPPHVKANAFKGNGGFLYPLVLAGNGTNLATVRLRGLPTSSSLAFSALHPGREGHWIPVQSHSVRAGVVDAQVPLSRGCALLRVTAADSEFVV